MKPTWGELTIGNDGVTWWDPATGSLAVLPPGARRMIKVRRCQGWVTQVDIQPGKPSMLVGLPDIMPMALIVVAQCGKPAIDGVHCEQHQQQIPEEWMDSP